MFHRNMTWHRHLFFIALQWRHNEHDSVLNHQPHDCLINRLFRRRSKKTPKLRVTGLCAGNSPGTGEFPAQMASYAENVSIWWRHHVEIQPLWRRRGDMERADFFANCTHGYFFVERKIIRGSGQLFVRIENLFVPTDNHLFAQTIIRKKEQLFVPMNNHAFLRTVLLLHPRTP